MKLLKGWSMNTYIYNYYGIKSLSWIVLYRTMQWRHLLKWKDSFLGNEVWNSFCLNDSAKILLKNSLDTSVLRVGEMRTPQWNNSVIQWFHWGFGVLLPWTPFVEITVNDLLINLFMLVKPLQCQNKSEEASDIIVKWLSIHTSINQTYTIVYMYNILYYINLLVHSDECIHSTLWHCYIFCLNIWRGDLNKFNRSSEKLPVSDYSVP